MARLSLKLDNDEVGEYWISDTPVTIGRLPENTIQLDNLSVSGRHARIVREEGAFVLYDENSTNGSYVNGQRVSRAVLTSGDTVHVGRHIISFSDEGIAEKPATAKSSSSPEVFGANGKPIGVLKVVSGKTDQPEYVLNGAEAIIGKSDAATVRLTRWFAPKIAAIIHRREGKYFITESETPIAVRVNSETVFGEKELAPGDTILVDEISLTFHLQN